MNNQVMIVAKLLVAMVAVRLATAPANLAFAADDDTIILGVAPAPADVAKTQPKAIETQVVFTNVDAVQFTIPLPMLCPSPLGFSISTSAMLAPFLGQTNKVEAVENHAPLVADVAVAAVQPNALDPNAIQQQVRTILLPVLKAELSFAARAVDANPQDRKKLTTDGKQWFDKFIADFLKKQDPNQQQMLLQNLQGMWSGNQQPRPEDPREAIRAGVAKLVAATLPKEKASAYSDECRKRDEFARQTSVENLVERIDDKLNLSPEQWKKIAASLDKQSDKAKSPQLANFVMNSNSWPGAPEPLVAPELTPAQLAVFNRLNTTTEQAFFPGGIFGAMFGGDGGVVDDIELDTNPPVPVVAPVAPPAK